MFVNFEFVASHTDNREITDNKEMDELGITQEPKVTQDQANVNKSLEKKPLYAGFRVPMDYLESDKKHTISDIVASDMELVSISSERKGMYDNLMAPSTPFSKSIVGEHSRMFTSDVEFLKDTQNILQKLDTSKYVSINSEDCSEFMNMWHELKEDAFFLEKYSYMDWKILESFNRSSDFLQILSIANILSPITSFLIPILFLILPFFLLKVRGISVSFSEYIDTLRDIARHHFIGKLLNIRELSLENVAYFIFIVGLYAMQMYNNITSCIRFYRNVHRMNEYLCFIRKFCDVTIHNINLFTDVSNSATKYTEFIKDATKHRNILTQLCEELSEVTAFTMSMKTINRVGYMLKCYYSLHSNPQYESALRYAVGFAGYIQTMSVVSNKCKTGRLAMAEFVNNGYTEFKGQWYAGTDEMDTPITNTCVLRDCMVITGVNASGKTTFLKTSTLNVIFTQQFGCGYYQSCVIQPYTHIHSYLNIPDTSGRDSLFQAEARRCKEILDAISLSGDNARHFCIFDELYSGTNPDEATKSAIAFLRHLATRCPNVDFILTTHYIRVCKKLRRIPRIKNYQMVVLENERDELEYTYKIRPGISHIQGGIHVLRKMGYPAPILRDIELSTRGKGRHKVKMDTKTK